MDTSKRLGELVEKFKDFLVIVEGKNDKKALKELGCTNIITLNKPLYKIVEDVVKKEVKECIILTDLDKKGKRLYAKLNSDLGQRGVKVNNTIRNFLFKHTHLSQIEGIVKYVRDLI